MTTASLVRAREAAWAANTKLTATTSNSFC